MKKEKISSYLIFISVLTFLTIFILVVQKGYTNLIGPINKAQAFNLLNRIDPNLDLSVISQIEKREELEFIESPAASVSSETTVLKNE